MDTKQPLGPKRCGAKSKRTGKPCRNWAMANGRCRMHGGKSTGAPRKNDNALTHGLFAKHLPKETLEIMEDIENADALNILWENIKMQFASIIRAQKIMYVEDKEDHSTFKTKNRVDEKGAETTYEVQASWDKQATFMKSLSRSMAELRNMLKQYVELANYDDDRLLEVEKMRATINKLNAEAEKDETTEDKLKEFFEKLDDAFDE